jgi:hypothetical protein
VINLLPVSHLYILSTYLFIVEIYHSACRYYSPWMISALCGAFIVLYQSLLEFLATCGCVQGRVIFCASCCCRYCSCIQYIYRIFKRTIECCGGSIFVFFALVSIALVSWSALTCYFMGSKFDIFVKILISKVWSIGEWFLWSTPYFMYRYPRDKRRYQDKIARKSNLRHRNSKKEKKTTLDRAADIAAFVSGK